MNHLIVCREYPPSPYPGGGIGTYVDHMSRLLASHGETVHVIGQLCPAAPRPLESRMDGRLLIHRVPIDEPLPQGCAADRTILQALGESVLPSQAFAWQAAILAESLIQSGAIDVVEAQEYEAPLYFFMLRRARGMSAAPPVPLIVHLHTPTEFVFEQNEWDRSRPDYLPQKQLEDYTIRAADALLCPSRFLAATAERHYGLARGSIRVVPYPMADVDVVPRGRDVWSTGTICYVGRMETRKGVTEWIDAAVAVARDVAGARFSFIGGDTSLSGTGDRSVREAVKARIPPALRARFTFVDNISRQRLARYLAQSRIAVVPSRWENFPYTCIEAMSSGLPVLATPTGGMAEMIEDGRSGWVAAEADSRSLEAALRRALAAPARALEQMGAAAARRIRMVCDDHGIVREQLQFRRSIVSRAGSCAPELEDRKAAETALLEQAILTPRAEVSRTGSMHRNHTMTPLEILTAGPRQQLAVFRRALRHPGYVPRWLAWHIARATRRLAQ